MESHDLLIFKHVAESHSFSKTAEKLGYVQSNISQRIKNLEEELGVRLFKRNNRGVTLTNDGEILLDYANQILVLMDEAKIKINPEKWQERLVIGATQTIAALRIPKILSSFLSVNNQINVKVRTDTTSTLLEQVFYGEVDGAFVTEPFDYSEFKTIYTIAEKVSLISPKNSSNKMQYEQTLLVNSNPYCIYRNMLIHLAKMNSYNNIRTIEFDSLEAILQSVSNGLGISLVPSDVAKLRKYQNEYDISELPETIQIDFVIKNRQQQPKGLKSFIKFLLEE
ncbi:LysR family transcriptional regulator [Domibacillus aminovorans]|uniref:Transcriptional regulator n=1 Tax=Domibacillus aminovorans TaxID=29332 RepID=A0A177L473_9BACI|nr:LysR family transcriptional regulator [Domibacillus aminovorans]OAH60127.1 transcriptional regulator [Domibacillus aminovorans]